MPHQFQGESVIWSQDFRKEDLEEIFRRADHFQEHPRNDSLDGQIVMMLFYEASTRTRVSFESAVLGLGGHCISTENAREFSSVAKGETLEDTVRVISKNCDAIVLRHADDDAAMRARDRLQMDGILAPIFNAGCGGIRGQHPTQSALDLYTILKKVGRLDNLHVVMMGDHKHSRVARSLAYMLGKYSNNKIDFISPPELRIGGDILAYLHRHDVRYTETKTIDDVIESADVVYVTRVQRERFENETLYEQLKHSYRLTVKLAQRMKPGAHIMHPLPKVDEIDPEVDRLAQAAYFEQSDTGLLIRKALLEMVLAG